MPEVVKRTCSAQGMIPASRSASSTCSGCSAAQRTPSSSTRCTAPTIRRVPVPQQGGAVRVQAVEVAPPLQVVDVGPLATGEVEGAPGVRQQAGAGRDPPRQHPHRPRVQGLSRRLSRHASADASADAPPGPTPGAVPGPSPSAPGAPGLAGADGAVSWMAPSCCSRPRPSDTSHSSASLPSPIRCTACAAIVTTRPVGATPWNGPRWVPRSVSREATRSPSATTSSTTCCKSGTRRRGPPSGAEGIPVQRRGTPRCATKVSETRSSTAGAPARVQLGVEVADDALALLATHAAPSRLKVSSSIRGERPTGTG